jgi:5'-nucleotidase / UDP-sugar diphosphatase
MRPLLAAILLVAAAQAQDVRRISIIHSNDLHARLLPDGDGMGGWARVLTLANRERQGCGHCVYVNAGDLVQGTPVSTLYKGVPLYEIAKLFRFDVASLGNHEFDYGPEQVSRFVKTANFPLVTANVVNNAGELITGRGYIIKNVNGLRVAFIGGVMTNLFTDLQPGGHSGPWKTLPIVDTVRELSEKLRPEVDLIVVVAHIFQREGSAIIREAPAVSVVIEGHTHDGREELEVVDNRVAAGCKGYGVELCRLNLEFDRDQHKLVSWNWKRMPVVAAEIPPEPKMQRLIDKWERRVSAVVDVKIAHTDRDWNRGQLAQLFAQAFRDEMQADFSTYGSVRDEIKRGTVLARHIWNAIPFDNEMMVATVPGSQVPAYFRKGQTLDPTRQYKIALDGFVATNESSIERLGLAGIKFHRINRLGRDVVIDWIKKKKTF